MKHFSKFCAPKIIYPLLLAVLMILMVIALFSGSADISADDVIHLIKNGVQTVNGRIFVYSRLPRVLGAVFVGAALSVAGAVIQNVLNNRLASPSIIGVNAGAGLFVTLAAFLGIYGTWRLSGLAFLGAFLAILIICAVQIRFNASRTTVILTGVALNSILNAITDILITVEPALSLMNADFRIGDFSSVTLIKLIPLMITVFISLIILLLLNKELDIVSLGESTALSLGVSTRFLRTVFLIISAFLAGSAVSIAGLISFIGLVIPNTVKMLGFIRAKSLIPVSALLGGIFVLLADTLARTLFIPYEIPVGIIIALVGAPFFVFILFRRRNANA